MPNISSMLLTALLLGWTMPRLVWGGEVELRITHQFSDQPLILDSLRYSLESGEEISVTRLSYFLSGFALEKAGGGWVQPPESVAWMDAAQRRTSTVLTNIPEGKYRSIRFFVGLEKEENEGDSSAHPRDHPLNPLVNGLHWSWQGGYIFCALEGRWREGGGQIQGFSWHFARSPNRSEISLPVELEIRGGAAVDLSLDLARLLSPPLSMRTMGNSTHSREDDPIAAQLKTNFPEAFLVVRTTDATPAVLKPAPTPPKWMPEKFTPWPFRMSRKFPLPALPLDNPLLTERVTLGQRLFSEPLLSRTGKLSCASCHDSAHAFSDPRQFSRGVDDAPTPRHAMPLFNLAWKTSFFWDGRAATLREQALQPIQDHLEMDEKLDRVAEKLAAHTDFPELFERAFGSPRIDAERIGLALENYLLTIVSCDSKFDRAMSGGAALTELERRGFELFFTEYEPRSGQLGADCFHCHGGADFSDHQFHNNGLDAAPADLGREKVSGLAGDRGKFSTPSLRNVALTAPYMHDGRFATLEEVLDHYSGRVQASASLDPNLSKHPGGIALSPGDKSALIAFLKTLSDPQFSGKQP